MSDLPEIHIGDGSGNEQYRTCTEPVDLPGGGQGKCGADCDPEPLDGGAEGTRIAFLCPEHGLHSVVDPFEDKR
ncbi:MAG: hypothetical protein ACK5LO_06570 [Leucobacter sp.]